jgi:hypothetical protein
MMGVATPGDTVRRPVLKGSMDVADASPDDPCARLRDGGTIVKDESDDHEPDYGTAERKQPNCQFEMSGNGAPGPGIHPGFF